MDLVQCHQVDEQGIYQYSIERRRLGARQVSVAPPVVPPGQLARWESPHHPFADVAWVTDGQWALHEDHRTDEIHTQTGLYELGADYNGSTYDGVGPIPEWATNVARPSAHHNLVQGVWVLDVEAELADAKASRIQVLSALCEADIYAGFTSSALGASHHYLAKDKDQQNLTASVLDSTVPGLLAGWQTPFCCESGGVWDFRMHTAEQIQQVGRDGKARILACLTLNKSLSDQVLDAATKAEVEGVVWVSPV